MPDGVNIPGGPSFIGNPQPPDVPCDPVGDGWRGPQGPQGPPGQSTAFYGASPPGDVLAPLWWDTVSGQLFIQYNDGSSTQWVVANSTIANGGPFLPITGGTVTGPLTLATTLKVTGATTLGNYTLTPTSSFSGVAGTNALLLGATAGSKTLILSKGGGTTADDFADVQIVRNTTFTNATTTKQNAALRVSGSIGANDQSRNWLFTSVLSTANTGGGSAVNSYNQLNKTGSGPTYVACGIFNTQDQTVLASSASSSGGTIGIELDVCANRADDGANLQMFGGKGVRVGLDIVGIRYSSGDTTQTEISHGIWFSTSGLTGGSPDNNTNFNSAIGFAVNTQTYQALDTRAAIIPTGYAGPMAAVRMLHDQIIDFNGGAALNSTAGAYLQYRSATQRLYYVVAGVDQWSIDASGNVRARGTVTGSTTP